MRTWRQTAAASAAPRDWWLAIKRGLHGRCPNCGEGRIFRAFLKVSDSCPACGEALHHHRADDLPAYLVIVIVGHIVVPLALAVETRFAPPIPLQLAIYLPLTLVLSLVLLQPVKGAVVGLHGTRREKLDALAAELGDRVHVFPANLSDRDAVKALGDTAESTLEGVDILVNNAGITKDGLFVRMSDEDWDSVIEVNLTSVFRLTRELTRLGVPHDHVEHDGGHFGLDSRYHVALPRLIHALGA